ncbi:MAG: serine/threonine protein kinase [Myxococcota bacterium]|jgi:serine/threonine protein kinase
MSWFCPACLTRFPASIDRCPADGWPPVEDLSGTELSGRYKLERLIGVGGMGSTVWLARQTHIDRPVAVKLLPPSGNETPMRRFAREARIASHLRHPNIVTIYDYGSTDDGKLFLVMEYLEGQTLEQLLRAHAPLDVDRALHIAIQCLRALSHAHSKRVVHRDLKPSNLFLTPTGDDPDFLKVLDFGLAKYFADGQEQSTPQDMDVTGVRQVVCGTPGYMAPEQWRGKIDARADVYGIGVVLYRMLCNELPFSGGPDYELYHKVITQPIPPLRTVRPRLQLPPGLEGVVLKALARDPEQRFAGSREMRVALEQIRGPLPVDSMVVPVAISAPPANGVACTDPEGVYLMSQDFESVVTPSRGGLSRVEQRRRRSLPWLVALGAGLLTVVFGLFVLPGLLGDPSLAPGGAVQPDVAPVAGPAALSDPAPAATASAPAVSDEAPGGGSVVSVGVADEGPASLTTPRRVELALEVAAPLRAVEAVATAPAASVVVAVPAVVQLAAPKALGPRGSPAKKPTTSPAKKPTTRTARKPKPKQKPSAVAATPTIGGAAQGQTSGEGAGGGKASRVEILGGGGSPSRTTGSRPKPSAPRARPTTSPRIQLLDEDELAPRKPSVRKAPPRLRKPSAGKVTIETLRD